MEILLPRHGLMEQLRRLEERTLLSLATARRRIRPTLDQLTYQRRQLVALLIDRVIINDAQVEIRYVVPTEPKGETTSFCHSHLDYFSLLSSTI